MSDRARKDAGSLLVDALVAIAIMPVILTFAAQAAGEGARRTAAGERSRLAVLEAQSRLAEVGADIPLSPGRASGEDGDLVWLVDIAPADAVASGLTGGLLVVVVTIKARDGPELATLRSLRVRAAA